MAAHNLKAMSGRPQTEREANCQERLAKCMAMTREARHANYMDGLNYDFHGGFSGLWHGAKKMAGNDQLPAATRAMCQEAADWGAAAFAAHKRGQGDLATHFAVKAAQAMSKACCSVALGWVGDAGEKS